MSDLMSPPISTELAGVFYNIANSRGIKYGEFDPMNTIRGDVGFAGLIAVLGKRFNLSHGLMGLNDKLTLCYLANEGYDVELLGAADSQRMIFADRSSITRGVYILNVLDKKMTDAFRKVGHHSPEIFAREAEVRTCTTPQDLEVFLDSILDR